MAQGSTPLFLASGKGFTSLGACWTPRFFSFTLSGVSNFFFSDFVQQQKSESPEAIVKFLGRINLNNIPFLFFFFKFVFLIQHCYMVKRNAFDFFVW